MLRTAVGLAVFSLFVVADYCFGIFQEEPNDDRIKEAT